ncbi:THO complex subunit 1 [Capsicum baccatum]|uniref:THO complex subunit 1 n=1 Tax=Capsicum baccatum TaxID=33114 RepID=A0A2G2W718_CAPBA|nr:THO complex subunit 1 [Capsicum baccatum]
MYVSSVKDLAVSFFNISLTLPRTTEKEITCEDCRGLQMKGKQHGRQHHRDFWIAWNEVGECSVMDLFRQAILRPEPPEEFALLTVQQAINPQKQTKLVQDENQLLENILRSLLQELVAAAVQSGQKVMQYGVSIADGESSQGQIPRLLDIVLYLCEKEHVEGGMIFQLLEDLTEMSTMRNCEDVFGYIESKQDILGKPELFARGKLVMLRTCNQLLRRLSKANDVVFCGRIIMFLAHFFPLSERSAVNIKGVFNTSNETKYETEAPEGISIDFNFYKTLWSLQEYFCNPPSLVNAPGKWHKFTSSLMVVLNTFEAQPLSDEEGNAHNLEDDAATFNIKYLTSSKLMGLELKDPSFRRHVLVQCLILFDYLKAPGKSEKELPSEAMEEEIKTSEERVKKLLEMTPPKGIDFLRSIEHILERERNWVWWKRDGCPPFEKQPEEKKLVQDGTKKRRPRWRLGNKELSQLWRWADQYPDALTDTKRVCTPSITDYWKPLAEDMDESAGIEAEYHHKNNRERVTLFDRIRTILVASPLKSVTSLSENWTALQNSQSKLSCPQFPSHLDVFLDANSMCYPPSSEQSLNLD